MALCARAAGDGDAVLGAWSTTVRLVRERKGGPAPGYSPAAKPWAALPGDTAAAWCSIDRGGSYAVAAAGPHGELVDFMVTQCPPGDFPDGPAIP
jgi:hypothetical protein